MPHENEDYWKKVLTPEQYSICREANTEKPFTGQYWNCKESGRYLCSCCGQVLFKSTTKFDSGTGWPSFNAPADQNAVSEKMDHHHGMQRTEVLCSQCQAHLGHVFTDGPQPTGLRYCINSVALVLEKDNDK